MALGGDIVNADTYFPVHTAVNPFDPADPRSAPAALLGPLF